MNFKQLLHTYASEQPPKIINHVSPSQLGGCLRAHYLNIKHIAHSTPKDAQMRLNLQSGFMWEETIEKALRHSHVPYMRSLKLTNPDLNLEGEIDFVLPVITNGELQMDIWDAKTERNSAASYRKTLGYFATHEEYVHQLNAYALLLMYEGYDVRRGGFVVVRRDTSEIETHGFDYDQQSVEATLARIKLLNNYLERDELPPCDGKWCKAGLCDYGNPATRKNGKNTECCGSIEQIQRWGNQLVL